MSHILHILTTTDDALAQRIISAQKEDGQHIVKTVDLTAPDADYRALLHDIFFSDSIEVW